MLFDAEGRPIRRRIGFVGGYEREARTDGPDLIGFVRPAEEATEQENDDE